MSLSTKLIEQRDALVAEVEATIAAEDVTAEALDAASVKQDEIAALDERIATAQANEKRTAELAESRKASGVAPFGGVKVVSEQMTYDKGSENSYFRDLTAATIRGDRDAFERLYRHQKEVAIETRDISRTDTAGGDFVPPLYLTNEYAEFARAARVAADKLTGMALPVGTDSINIPAITLGTKTAFQSADNAATTTRDMVTSTASGAVRTISGYENASIQLVEQSPLAGGLDRMIFGDLMADYALQLNTAVLGNGDGTNGTIQGLVNKYNDSTNSIPVTWTETTPTAQGGLLAIAKAISKVVTNRFRSADAIIMSPQMWYWFISSVDSANRPLVVPLAGGPMNANGVVTAPGAPAGLVGTIHGVPVYIDATMPNNLGAGTNQTPILVGKFDDSYLFEGGVKTRVLPDVLSANLTVRFQAYGYVTAVHRFAKNVSVITGTGTIVPTGF